MNASDWDDPAVEERWCSERRQIISEYLSKKGLSHGEIGEWPAWHLTPYVSLWAVESLKAPGHVGWWVICGDLPTDYLSAETVKHPRAAMLAFTKSWKDVASGVRKGEPLLELSLGPPDPEHAASLENRSDLLRRVAEDDSVWGPEYD